mmetsp:Transcript_48336/g.103267  ORF Transcript_48336/g.103267 Transcript_48336/m.103267 type:complete len:207 (+) Transcript_48336:70-690(+)
MTNAGALPFGSSRRRPKPLCLLLGFNHDLPVRLPRSSTKPARGLGGWFGHEGTRRSRVAVEPPFGGWCQPPHAGLLLGDSLRIARIRTDVPGTRNMLHADGLRPVSRVAVQTNPDGPTLIILDPLELLHLFVRRERSRQGRETFHLRGKKIHHATEPGKVLQQYPRHPHIVSERAVVGVALGNHNPVEGVLQCLLLAITERQLHRP